MGNDACLLGEELLNLIREEVVVLTASEVYISRNLENQQRDVGTDSATVKLIRMKLLTELNQRESCILRSVVDITGPSQWIVSEEIRRGFIFLEESSIINRALRLLQRWHQGNRVLGG